MRARVLNQWKKVRLRSLCLAVMALIFILTVFRLVRLNSSELALDDDYQFSDGNSQIVHSRIGRAHGSGKPLNISTVSKLRRHSLVRYDRHVPLIWIGGVPRSGTTLMRAMLDAHPDIRCGEETRIIPRLLGIHQGIAKSEVEMARLLEAKVTEEVLDEALGAYLLSVISGHGEAAPRLCNKDPFTLRSMRKLLQIFSNSQFVLMVRDGRATVHSIIERHVSIRGFNTSSYRAAMKDWNRAISTMYDECRAVGPAHCRPVCYEQLVLEPEAQMRSLLDFLSVPWDDVVVHHEVAIGRAGGVSLSKKELSTDQVNKPINSDALTTWIRKIPDDVRRDMRTLAPMLEVLGYDADAYPPNYSALKKQVMLWNSG